MAVGSPAGYGVAMRISMRISMRIGGLTWGFLQGLATNRIVMRIHKFLESELESEFRSELKSESTRQCGDMADTSSAGMTESSVPSSFWPASKPSTPLPSAAARSGTSWVRAQLTPRGYGPSRASTDSRCTRERA